MSTGGEPLTKHVRVATVCVRDQQRALDFYTEVLGFEKRQDASMGPDARWIEVAPHGAPTALVLFTPPGMEGRIGTFTGLVIECVDTASTPRHDDRPIFLS
jgi:catechol 2,3-dioxygenase-like lactoylglutathione lyase family enzyme